jgi:ubiquinone/menaquinone biosynthesis C-methylase UbiE
MNSYYRDFIYKREFYRKIIDTYTNPFFVEKYTEKIFDERRLPIKRMIEDFANRIRKGGRVIDIGCGTGKEVVFLRSKSINAIGIDISSAMIRKACDITNHNYFIVGDFRKLNYFRSQSFDGVLSLASLQHAYRSDIAAVLKQIYLLLRERGIILIITKEGQGLYLDTRLGEEFPRPTTLFKREELRVHLIAQGFRILSMNAFSLMRQNINDRWIAFLASRL